MSKPHLLTGVPSITARPNRSPSEPCRSLFPSRVDGRQGATSPSPSFRPAYAPPPSPNPPSGSVTATSRPGAVVEVDHGVAETAFPKQRSSSSSSFTRMLLGRDRLPTPWVHPRPSRMTQPGVGRSSAPRSATRGPVGLTEVCVEAVLRLVENGRSQGP